MTSLTFRDCMNSREDELRLPARGASRISALRFDLIIDSSPFGFRFPVRIMLWLFVLILRMQLLKYRTWNRTPSRLKSCFEHLIFLGLSLIKSQFSRL